MLLNVVRRRIEIGLFCLVSGGNCCLISALILAKTFLNFQWAFFHGSRLSSILKNRFLRMHGLLLNPLQKILSYLVLVVLMKNWLSNIGLRKMMSWIILTQSTILNPELELRALLLLQKAMIQKNRSSGYIDGAIRQLLVTVTTKFIYIHIRYAESQLLKLWLSNLCRKTLCFLPLWHWQICLRRLATVFHLLWQTLLLKPSVVSLEGITMIETR